MRHGAPERAGADRGRQRRERGQVAAIIARERGHVEAGDEDATASPLSTAIGGRSSIAIRVCSSARPCFRRDLVRGFDDRRLEFRCGPPVQRDTDTGFRLDHVRWKARLELGGRGRDGDEIRLHSRIDAVRTVGRVLHAVQADEGEAGDRELAGEEADRTTADDRDPAEARGQPFEHRGHTGKRARVGGPFDDRSQRSVKVDEQRRPVGALRQRGNRCVGIDHGGTLAAWTRIRSI